MGDVQIKKFAQFVCFKPRISIGEELFQETWIPRANAFRARGIESIILSQKANVKYDLSECIFISKTWWDSKDAIEAAFPDGLNFACPGISKRAPIDTAQVGCFQVISTKLGDPELNPKRHERTVEDEMKVYVMITKPLSRDDVLDKGETLCLVKGFHSYCIYELEKELSENINGFYRWIIEAYIQSFFKDSVLKEILDAGQFKGCDLVVHQDVVQFTI